MSLKYDGEDNTLNVIKDNQIDKFLNSDEQVLSMNEGCMVKVRYNENLVFIYNTYYSVLPLGSNLRFIGVYNEKRQVLYGESYLFNNQFNEHKRSKFYNGSIDSAMNDMNTRLKEMLKQYIDDNKEELKNKAKELFEKYISSEQNIKMMVEQAEKNYIYEENDFDNTYIIKAPDMNDKYHDTTLAYIDNPEQTLNDLFDEYINTPEGNERVNLPNDDNAYSVVTSKEYIGLMLLKNEYVKNKTIELVNNADGLLKKKHDILKAINGIDAKTLNISLNHNGERVSFKYPKNDLEHFNISYWFMPASDREKIRTLYNGDYNIDDNTICDIDKITYKGKTIYSDEKMLENQKNIGNEEEEDIEM